MMLCFLKSLFIYINLCHLCSHLKKPWITDPSSLHCNHTQRFAMQLPSFLSINAVPMCSARSTLFLQSYYTVEVVPCSFRPELYRAVLCFVPPTLWSLLHHLVSSVSTCQSLASVTDGFPDVQCWIIFNPVTDSFSDICHTSSNSAVPRLIISGICHQTTS